MLTIYLSATDDFDAVELSFEHSLVSLSKWESQFKKVFFSNEKRTSEETAAYIKCMLLTENAPEDSLGRLSKEEIETISLYINDKQSATWFGEESSQKKSSEVVTSELIYYWLVQFNIPFEVERWHLNRLFNLVKIAGIKQTKPKPMTKAQQQKEYQRLNAERRAASGSSG
jgi:hypothetical protein